MVNKQLSLKNFEKNNGKIFHNLGVQKLLETYPERLTALIAAKGDSNMYCEYLNVNTV